MTTPALNETFGYKLSGHRVAKNLTEAQLADELNRDPRPEPVTEAHVKSWEAMSVAPDAQLFEALCEILIDESVAIDDKMKPVARENLKRAYDTFREALQKGSVEALMAPGAVTFGNLIRHHRERAGLSEHQLAERISDTTKLDTLTAQHIVDFQYNQARPSFEHTRRMADIFELDPASRTDFYGAHKDTKVQIDCTEFDARRDAITRRVKDANLPRGCHTHLSYKRPVESHIEAVNDQLLRYGTIAGQPEDDNDKQRAARENWTAIAEDMRQLHRDYKNALERAGGSISQHMRGVA